MSYHVLDTSLQSGKPLDIAGMRGAAHAERGPEVTYSGRFSWLTDHREGSYAGVQSQMSSWMHQRMTVALVYAGAWPDV